MILGHIKGYVILSQNVMSLLIKISFKCTQHK